VDAPHLQLEDLQTVAQATGDGALVAGQGLGGLLAGAPPQHVVERGQLLDTQHGQHNQQ